MKKLFLILLLTIIVCSSWAQVVITDPSVPLTNESVIVTFNAAQGNGELAGYTGDVYAHTGLITNLSTQATDWRYVVSGWGENTPETKLTRIDDDLYTLEIGPSIREYYSVPANEQIEQLAFVFRSAETVGGGYLVGRDDDGGDIFVDVFEEGLNVVIISPDESQVILTLNEQLDVDVQANDATKVSLYIDDVLVKEEDGNSLQHSIVAGDFESHIVKAIAEDATSSVADSFYYTTRPEVVVEDLPSGIRDGINYLNDETVILSLLAPEKENIYVIGDFNNWTPDNAYFMKLTPDSLRFWLEINNLLPGEEYIFQYLIDGEIRVGDPYADKTSDPWNDKYISETTYPGLIDYPDGKTTGVASVLQTAQPEYTWEVDDFEPVKKTDMVIYEMLIRDFTTEHSYAAVIEKLDYLDSLGINVLELMPVNEFEGNSSWGYNPSFYFAPDKYYGPKNELKRLIDECHKRDIAVVLDIVLNHSYDQSPMVQMYFDGAKPLPNNPWYNREHNFENTSAQWGNDFNHESIHTQNFIDSVNSYWMSEYRVDGFRFDFTKGFSNTYHSNSDPWGNNYDIDRINILKRMAIKIWERNENAIVILEHLAEDSEEENLASFGMLMWGNMNYNYAEASMAYHDGNKSDFSGISYKKRGWSEPNLLGYMESHDEERIMFKNVSYGNSNGWWYNITDTTIALNRIRLVSAFFYTVPGPKMIWQFGELGYDYSIDYNGRLGEKPVRWDYYSDWRRNFNYKFISELIKLRIENDAFETEDFILDLDEPYKMMVLNGDEMDVVILGNFDVIELATPSAFTHTGEWYEYFTGETLMVDDVNMEISLKAGDYRIYTDVQLETPDIGLGAGPEEGLDQGNIQGKIFPNPVIGNTNLTFELSEQTEVGIGIFNVIGTKVISHKEKLFSEGSHSISIDTLSLAPGIYLCVVSTPESSNSFKFVKN